MKIGVDVGGTNLRAGLVEGGQLIEVIDVNCPADGSEQEVMEAIFDVIGRLWNPSVMSIGVGIPSLVNAEKGIVYNVVNIPSWKKVYLKEALESRFKVEVGVNNDVNCFALGTHCYGVARSFQHIVAITLGTGLGAGLIINDRLYGGNNTGAGEIGCLPYLEHNFEYYCSSAFFKRNYHCCAAELSSKFDEKTTARAWNEFGQHLGRLVCAVIDAYDPQAIVFGGGISRSFDCFRPAMLAEVSRFPFPETVRRLRILREETTHVALLGASLLIG